MEENRNYEVMETENYEGNVEETKSGCNKGVIAIAVGVGLAAFAVGRKVYKKLKSKKADKATEVTEENSPTESTVETVVVETVETK